MLTYATKIMSNLTLRVEGEGVGEECGGEIFNKTLCERYGGNYTCECEKTKKQRKRIKKERTKKSHLFIDPSKSENFIRRSI